MRYRRNILARTNDVIPITCDESKRSVPGVIARRDGEVLLPLSRITTKDVPPTRIPPIIPVQVVLVVGVVRPIGVCRSIEIVRPIPLYKVVCRQTMSFHVSRAQEVYQENKILCVSSIVTTYQESQDLELVLTIVTKACYGRGQKYGRNGRV